MSCAFVHMCKPTESLHRSIFFFFFPAPGRGVKVPGIILVHDPRWGPERKQGGFLPPPSPRPRTGCCALALCWPRLGLVPLGGGTPGTGPPERRALHHFFPALRAPRDPIDQYLKHFQILEGSIIPVSSQHPQKRAISLISISIDLVSALLELCVNGIK